MGRCAIAAGRDLTLEAAEAVLKEGGNAFDAAIAASFMIFASEPCMASAGAGGFAMCRHGRGEVSMLDFFTQTPRSKYLDDRMDFKPIQVDFGNEQEVFHVGAASVATPGMIAGLFELHEKLGSMPMKELVVPAQEAARNGVHVDAFGAIDLGLLQEIFRIEASVEPIFFEDGRIKGEGEYMVYPNLSDFLDFLAREGSDGFYKGQPGADVAQLMSEGRGYLTRKDFEEYKAEWRRPIRMPFHGHTLHLPNGPSRGAAILALLVEGHYGRGQAMQSILRDIKAIHEADEVVAAIHNRLPGIGYESQNGAQHKGGTTHFSIIDDAGQAIAMTLTLGEGSGCWIPGTDMQLNNMLGETYLLPDGAHSWSMDVRMQSMMCPVLLTDLEGNARFVTGSGGAGRIPYVMYQVLDAYWRRGLDLEEATIASRMHFHEGILQFEEGAEVDLKEVKDNAWRSWKPDSLFFGGVHSIGINDMGQMSAAADPRRFGVAKVFNR